MGDVPVKQIPTILALVGLPTNDCSSVSADLQTSESVLLTAHYPIFISLDNVPRHSCIRYSNGFSHIAITVEANLALYRDLRCLIEGVQ